MSPSKQSGIYQIRNLMNNHIYLGSAVNLNRRRLNHFSALRNNMHHSIHLQRAFNKYGEENFIFEILITCHTDLCIFYEQQFLDQWKPEYNIHLVAGHYIKTSSKGRVMSKETKIKLSNFRKNYYKLNPAPSGSSSPIFGIKRSDATKKKISEKAKLRIINPMKGKHHTDETKLKISEARKRYEQTKA